MDYYDKNQEICEFLGILVDLDVNNLDAESKQTIQKLGEYLKILLGPA